MATAYYADNYNDNPVFIPGVMGVFAQPFSFNLANNATLVAAGGFIINDTLALCQIPYKGGGGGVLVLGYNVELPELDTGNTIRVSLGDTGGSAGAFQATYFNDGLAGGTAAGVINPLMSFNDGTTAEAPVRGATPKQYTAATASNGSLDFMLKIITAPGSGTVTGIIKGYLLMQPLGSNSVTF